MTSAPASNPASNPEITTEITAAAMLTNGLEAYGRSALEPALEMLIRAEGQARIESAWEVQAQALIALGKTHRDLGEPDRALERLDQALELARLHNDPVIEGDALNQRAGVNHLSGEYARALKDLGLALQIARRFNDQRRAANCLINIGILSTKLADFPRALSALSEAHTLVREQLHDPIHDPNIEAQCLINLGNLYEGMGDDQKMLETYQLALETVSGLDNRLLEAITTVNLGYAHKRLGQLEAALQRFEDALGLARGLGHAKVEIAALDGLGQVQASLGQTAAALEFHLAALERSQDTGDVESEMDALLNLGRVYLSIDPQRAIQPLTTALERAEQTGRQKTIFEAHELLAEIHDRLGNTQQALEHFRAFHRVEKLVFNQEREQKIQQLSIQFDLERAQHEAEVYRLRTDLEREAKEQAEQTVRQRTHELEMGHRIIELQRSELQEKVERLHQLLEQNETLRHRLVLAATRSTALNERFLRRLSAELHDGPAQELGFALLKLDSGELNATAQHLPIENRERYGQELERIQTAISRALSEMRAIASGMCLPELEHLSLVATLGRVIQTHKRRTQSDVTLLIERSPVEVPLPIKITAYRIVQESLTNAFKHGGGKDQTVRLLATPEEVLLEIIDHGPGFQLGNILERNERLGLVGMRERAESLGGTFQIISATGQGTQVSVTLPLRGSSSTPGIQDA
jgi:signal transduction histidine kinase